MRQARRAALPVPALQAPLLHAELPPRLPPEAPGAALRADPRFRVQDHAPPIGAHAGLHPADRPSPPATARTPLSRVPRGGPDAGREGRDLRDALPARRARDLRGAPPA